MKPGRNLYANVEFYAGVVMEEAGLPRDLFTPTFASSRVIGWCANMLEQAADNRIIRPSARYVGPPPPSRSRRLLRVEVFEGDASELTGALDALVPQLSKSNPPPTRDEVEAMLASDAITQFVARDDSGAIIGVSTLAVFPIPTARRAWIEDVIVDESARGQGVARHSHKR